MATKKQKYYAVKAGRQTGLYATWDECKKQVIGFPGARYKSFEKKAEAEAWLQGEAEVQNSLGNSGDEEKGADANPGFSSLTGKACEAPGGLSSRPVTVDYDVYTDGSYVQGQYSWAYAFVKDDRVVYEGSNVGNNPEAAVMRNVAGEIAAALYAVKRAAELQAKIRIFHDYAGIAFWVTGEWKAKNKFTQLYAKLMNEHRGLFIFEKVKSHSGNKFNDYVDELAKAALGITASGQAKQASNRKEKG